MTTLPRTRHITLISAIALTVVGLATPSSASNNIVSVPSAAQIAQIRTLSQTTVAQRTALLAAQASLKSAQSALTKAQGSGAKYVKPLAAAVKVQKAKQAAATKAQSALVAAQQTVATLTTTQTSISSILSGLKSMTAANAVATQANIATLQKALGIAQSGRWDAASVAAYAKYQKTLGYKGATANGTPDAKSLAALVKKTTSLQKENTKALKSATATVKSATKKATAANKALAIATAKVATLQARVNGTAPPETIAAVATAQAAVAASQAAYDSNLSSLNAITTVIPYSSDICVPGQKIGQDTVQDCGVVTHVADGDTINVKTDTMDKMIIRTLGVQAPEIDHLPAMPAQCGGPQAMELLQSLLPNGIQVQLRSNAYESYNTHTSEHRYYREIYIKDADGNFTHDTADDLYTGGLAIWFPLAKVPGSLQYESIPNKRYFEELLAAASQGKGMWSKTLCHDPVIPGYDPQRNIVPQLWALMNPSGTDDVSGLGSTTGEFIVVKNPASSTQDLNLSYWELRDTALNFFRFPEGTLVKPGHAVRVYVGQGTADPANGIYYFGLTKPLFQNYDSALYNSTGYLLGDGVYLTDRQGPSHTGGNMRAWFHNPCKTQSGEYTSTCKPYPATSDLSTGAPTTDLTTVPNVIGLTADPTTGTGAAKTALQNARLTVSSTVIPVVDPAHVGKVVGIVAADRRLTNPDTATYREAGTPISADTRVEFYTAVQLRVGVATLPSPTPTTP